MIELGYRLLKPFDVYKNLYDCLDTASETDIHYRLFTGDVLLHVNDCDFSAEWSWIPLVGFSATLQYALRQLKADQKANCSIDFTEADEEIFFERQRDNIGISTTFAPGNPSIRFLEFISEANRFAIELLGDVFVKYPAFKKNAALRDLFDDTLIFKSAKRSL